MTLQDAATYALPPEIRHTAAVQSVFGTPPRVGEELQDEYQKQSEKLATYVPSQEDSTTGRTQATEARFVTAQDPVVVTADGGRLPTVPYEEAVKLNRLRDQVEGRDPDVSEQHLPHSVREGMDGTKHGVLPDEAVEEDDNETKGSTKPDAPLRDAVPPSRTNPLFPPLPMYGPPSLLRDMQCLTFRVSSFFLSLAFLGIIVMGAFATYSVVIVKRVWYISTLRNPAKKRPFYKLERERAKRRREEDRAWMKRATRRARSNSQVAYREDTKEENAGGETADFTPTEGGPDRLVDDVGYYARRVGLDAESFTVQTEDGFYIELWHLYNPLEYDPLPADRRGPLEPDTFTERPQRENIPGRFAGGQKRYPVLMVHGLLQSAGAFCCTDDLSPAFVLAKAGFDIWLGNNRCGPDRRRYTSTSTRKYKHTFHDSPIAKLPYHSQLPPSDPRTWAWNIRQMGCIDLAALISRVLRETGFPKLGLVAHSQGTTQTLVALAKEQRPELGEKISVFCALAPAAYAGPLIGKAYFKFIRLLPSAMFRAVFGVHAFIPIMLTAHNLLPRRLYSWLGYRVFSFLFNWSDTRWERGLRARMFQFAPVYVSAESMRWWLGKECFATQKCILATREEGRMEEEEDKMEAEMEQWYGTQPTPGLPPPPTPSPPRSPGLNANSTVEKAKDKAKDKVKDKAEKAKPNHSKTKSLQHPSSFPLSDADRGRFAWYDERAPPMAFWVCGSDDLVDGPRLLRRFERRREPHVRVVHAAVLQDYEHLDVIWALDSVERVIEEVRDVLWRTVPDDLREGLAVPRGCEHLVGWDGKSVLGGPREVELEMEKRREGDGEGEGEREKSGDPDGDAPGESIEQGVEQSQASQ